MVLNFTTFCTWVRLIVDTFRIPSFRDTKMYLQMADVCVCRLFRRMYEWCLPQADPAQQSNFQLLSEWSLTSASPSEVWKGQTLPAQIYLIKRGGTWESTERFSKPQNGNNMYQLEVTIIHSSYLTRLKLHHVYESHLHSVCALLLMLIRCQHYVRMAAGRLELSRRQNYRYYLIGQKIKYAYIYNNCSRGLAQIDFTAQQLSGVSLLIKHSLGY